jgi:hypothetical protein
MMSMTGMNSKSLGSSGVPGRWAERRRGEAESTRSGNPNREAIHLEGLGNIGSCECAV